MSAIRPSSLQKHSYPGLQHFVQAELVVAHGTHLVVFEAHCSAVMIIISEIRVNKCQRVIEIVPFMSVQSDSLVYCGRIRPGQHARFVASRCYNRQRVDLANEHDHDVDQVKKSTFISYRPAWALTYTDKTKISAMINTCTEHK